MIARSLAAAGAAAALLFVSADAKQGQRNPGLGSDVATVQGQVHAAQRGTWNVGITGVPEVRVTSMPSPTFVRIGGRYRIVWDGDQPEVYTISALGPASWVRVDAASRRLWLNLERARAVEELQ